MNEKRFTIIDKQFISYYGGYGHQISDGECKFWLWHNKEESQKVCDKLNSVLDENEKLKQQLKSEHQMLKNAILLERTRMGQSALKQYQEAIK